jgi:hypothetical protein
MSLISELFEIRTRTEFSANDITMWLVKVLDRLYGIPVTRIKTEVIIRGKSRGRADLVAENSIGFETKRYLENELTEAETQTARILKKLEKEGDLSPIGVATDGVNWRLYVLVDKKPFLFHQFTVNEGTSDSEFNESFWSVLTALRREKQRPVPTAEATAEIFRPFGPVFNEARTLLITQLEYLAKEKPVAFISKFSLWFELFSSVYNHFETRCRNMSFLGQDLSNVVKILHNKLPFVSIDEQTLQGSIELFIRHTYLALIAKILSALVTLGEEGVIEVVLSDSSSILNGKAISQCGVYVSEENDFFEWPSEAPNQAKLCYALIRPLQRFSTDYTDDVFRHLYEDLVDPETRHELGEFFTPKWMAQLIVEDTITQADSRILDPACGSGTFLVNALKKKNQLISLSVSKKQPMSNILDEIWGIDVNPLSVILARTNLFLTLSSLLAGEEQPAEIRPRVYVADTFELPRFTDAEQRQLSEEGPTSSIISTPVTAHISVPILSRLRPSEATYWIDKVGEMLDAGTNELPQDLSGDEDLIEFQRALFKAMKDLRVQYGNSIWKFVLHNYGIPPLLRGQFDVVIGNPPWLSFREARKEIKDIMERIAQQFNIQPPIQTKTSFNLAVVFFLASSAFAKNGGVVGFVLPMSVLDSPAHSPFINLITSGSQFLFKKAYDLSGVIPNPFPHNLPSAIVIAEVGKWK